jgi:hypothetical protein
MKSSKTSGAPRPKRSASFCRDSSRSPLRFTTTRVEMRLVADRCWPELSAISQAIRRTMPGWMWQRCCLRSCSGVRPSRPANRFLPCLSWRCETCSVVPSTSRQSRRAAIRAGNPSTAEIETPSGQPAGCQRYSKLLEFSFRDQVLDLEIRSAVCVCSTA